AYIAGEISYVYINKTTKERLTQMPTAHGDYTLEVVAKALFCLDVKIEIDFTVELSQNGWVKAPTIDNWSEEFDPNNPTAQAMVGSENIQFFYATAEEPEKWTTVKPTAEGDYMLRAEVHVEGYEDLVSDSYAFTIDPAFDTTLVVVNIVLGALVMSFTVVVIYFAIRRYREC
ncbi:MAG: hypothetical protein K2L87_01815, partial [Clostridiales bacterium]|nr:hypothetical protein [Clostridiales bacterium]